MPVLQVLPTTTTTSNIRALPTTPSNNNDDNNTTTTTSSSSIAIHAPETHLKKTVSDTDACNMHDEGATTPISEQYFPTVPSHPIHLTPLQRPLSERVQATNNNGATSAITSNTTSTTNNTTTCTTTNSNTTNNNIHTSEAVLFNEYTPIVTAKPVTVNPNPLAIIRTTSQRYPTTTQHNKTVVDTLKIIQQPSNHSTRIETTSTLTENMHTGEVLCLFFYHKHLIIGNKHSLIIIYMLFFFLFI